MSTNVEYRERKRQRKKENVGRHAIEAQREKEIEGEKKKKQRRHFSWRNNMKFCSGGEKMINASGHLGENERQLGKK